MLVLSGPSGCGKTAVLRTLSDEMGIECVEYRNGGNLNIAGDGGMSVSFRRGGPLSLLSTLHEGLLIYFDLVQCNKLDRESMIHQLGTFLHRAGMSPALDFGPPPSSSSSLPPSLLPSPTKSKRLLLLEDLPNTSHYPTKLALRSSISQYLSSPRVTCPLVLIVSEALVRPGIGFENENTGGEDGGRGESLDCRNVLGGEVLGSPGLREIA